MGISKAVDELEQFILDANPALKEIHDAAASAGEIRMRELSARIAFPSWPGATSASALKSAAQEAEMFAVLDAYAASATTVLRPLDVDRWRSLVADAQRERGEGPFLDELPRSTVGASLLRDRLGGRGYTRPQRGGIDCACGYAINGVLPVRLCPECGDVLVRRWVAEERRLLRNLPDYAAAVTEVIEKAAIAQTTAITTRGDYRASDAEGRRRAGGRALARLRRQRGSVLPALDLGRWLNLGGSLSRDAREGVRKAAAAAAKRGLGAAALTELAVRGSEEQVREMSRFRDAGARGR